MIWGDRIFKILKGCCWGLSLIRRAGTDRIIRIGLVGILGFSAVFFGAVHVWAYTCVQLSLLCLTLLFLIVRIAGWWRSERGEISWIVTPINLTAFLFFAVVLMQTIPLPEWLIRFLSPNAARVFEMSEGVINGSSPGYRLSLYRHATLNSLMMLLACGYFYFLLLYSVKQRAELTSIVKAMVYLGIILSMYGMFEKLSGHSHILWWRHRSQAHSFRVFGTFVNPNHFAFFLNIILMLFFGHLYSLKGSVRKKRQNMTKRLFGSLVKHDSEAPQMIFLFFCFGIMLLTAVTTASRAGIFSLALSMAVISLLLFAKTKGRRLLLLMGISLLMVLAYGQRVGIEKTVHRFDNFSRETILEQGRMVHYRAVLPIIKEYPLVGTGLGTFGYVYPRYQPLEDKRPFTELHNDWLQLMVETGVIGFLVVFAGFLALMKSFVTVWWRRNDPYAVGIGIGCIGAMVASSIHSLFDFSLHIPANGIALTAVVAIGFLALHSNRQRLRERFFYRVKTIRLWGRQE